MESNKQLNMDREGRTEFIIHNILIKLNPYAQWKYVLIGLGLCLFINVILFPWAGNELREVAPKAAGPIDLKFSYSQNEVYQMIESYGEKGRDIYIMSTVGIDLIYPIIYNIVFILILIILFKKKYPLHGRKHLLAFLPIVVFFADILENTGILLMLNNYPDRLRNVAFLTSACTSIKWAFVSISLIMIIGLCLIKVRKKDG
ncbi:MAG: hypothetical protein V3V00_08650 [Saprospiraceae bacterium]